MKVPLDGTTPAALGELLGATGQAHVEALAVWQEEVLATAAAGTVEYLDLEDGSHLQVLLPGGLSWEVVYSRTHTHLAFYCVAGEDLGEPVIPMDTITTASVRQMLEAETEPEVHITHGDEHLRRRLGTALESAGSRAWVDSEPEFTS